jgi:hypothetical protein
MKLFLDLEETLIEVWQSNGHVNFLIDNIEKINKFIHDNGVSEIGIFSFAIWDDEDRENFITKLSPQLKEFGIEVSDSDVVPVENVAKTILKNMRINLDSSEVINLWGKDRAFIDWCRFEENGDHFVLIDDAVENCQVLFDNKSHIVIKNITTM